MLPLFNPTAFQELVSGRRRGWLATLVRGLLRGAEVPYAWAVTVRNRRYDQGRTPICRVSVPVISVGNITAGGTGKTPMVAWLAQWLRDRQLRVVLISRGYKADAEGANDEARELHQRLPDVPHLQHPDRVAAARQAVRESAGQVIVLDDAFQHRRLHRDLDIVLIDALQPFGFRHLLPRGLLREPLSQLSRADVIGLSRADAIDASQREALRAEIGRWAPAAAWVELVHRPCRLVNAAGDTEPPLWLSGRRVAAFCGIGNPAGFQQTLRRLGADLSAFHALPDHHAYQPTDMAALERRLACSPDVEAAVCTCKDLVKIDQLRIGGVPLWALAIEMDITRGRDVLEQRLESALKTGAVARS